MAKKSDVIDQLILAKKERISGGVWRKLSLNV